MRRRRMRPRTHSIGSIDSERISKGLATTTKLRNRCQGLDGRADRAGRWPKATPAARRRACSGANAKANFRWGFEFWLREKRVASSPSSPLGRTLASLPRPQHVSHRPTGPSACVAEAISTPLAFQGHGRLSKGPSMPIDSVPGRPQSPRRPKGVNPREPDRPAPISLSSPRAALRPLPSYSLPPHLQTGQGQGGPSFQGKGKHTSTPGGRGDRAGWLLPHPSSNRSTGPTNQTTNPTNAMADLYENAAASTPSLEYARGFAACTWVSSDGWMGQ